MCIRDSIYTASLLLSVSYVFVLFYLGSPDLGLMFSNYVGYWYMGAALIAVGMVASMLTSNATIGFIAGALLCASFIVTDTIFAAMPTFLAQLVLPFSMEVHFQEFAKGIISPTAIFYFLSVGGFFIYLNVLLLSRRHWRSVESGYPMWLHHSIRAVAVSVILFSFGTVLSRAATLRIDVTAERLHSLSN